MLKKTRCPEGNECRSSGKVKRMVSIFKEGYRPASAQQRRRREGMKLRRPPGGRSTILLKGHGEGGGQGEGGRGPEDWEHRPGVLRQASRGLPASVADASALVSLVIQVLLI